jgi:hypothetical protein
VAARPLHDERPQIIEGKHLGFGILDFGLRIDSGYSMLDTGYSMADNLQLLTRLNINEYRESKIEYQMGTATKPLTASDQ